MTYKYDKKKYFITITLTSIFIVFLLIYAVIKNIFSFGVNIYTFIILASCYELFNIYIAGVKPSEIELNNNSFILRGFRKEDVYEIQDLKYMMTKELANKKIYLRLNNYSLFKGRYWIDTKSYENSENLYLNIMELERLICPNQLKYNHRNKKIKVRDNQ